MPQRRSAVAAVLLGIGAVSLGVASYLHRDGHIPLGFTVIRGESFYSASIPEAVIGFVLAVAALAVLVRPGRSRGLAIGATAFAILGTAFGLTVTIPRGRVNDIAYHTALMALLLATGAVLVAWRPGLAGLTSEARPGSPGPCARTRTGPHS